MLSYINPFNSNQPDHAQIWNTLVKNDIQYCVRRDWPSAKADFLEEEFFGVDGNGSVNPANWTIRFPTLTTYGESWQRQALSMADTASDVLESALLNLTSLTDVRITGDRAVAYKTFNGEVPKPDGPPGRLRWLTVYYLKKVGAVWKITGFVGYLPLLEQSAGDELDARFASLPDR